MSKPCNGITIVPTKGVELVKPAPMPIGRYVPPSARVKKEPTLTAEQIASDKLFPTLGGATWPQIRERMAQPLNMLDRVKTSIEEAERNAEKEPETDTSKMTDEELEAAGWWRRRWPMRRSRLDEP
jgi:hypothetical protein